MNAPDRSAEVRAICEAHPEVFKGEGDDFDRNRRRFLPFLCAQLNLLEHGPASERESWGVLVKMDRRPPKIPCDVLVWKETGEHFDCFAGRGAGWNPYGPLPSPEWRWLSAQYVNPTGSEEPLAEPLPGEVPPPPGQTPAPEDPLAAALLVLLEPLERFADVLDDLAGKSDRNHDQLVTITSALQAAVELLEHIRDNGIRVRVR